MSDMPGETGETCRQLNNHFGEHLRNVGHKDHEKGDKIEHSDTNVSKHFNSDGHSTDDMAVFPTKIQQRERL